MAGSVNIPIKLDDGKGGMVPNPEFEAQVRAPARRAGCRRALVCAPARLGTNLCACASCASSFAPACCCCCCVHRLRQRVSALLPSAPPPPSHRPQVAAQLKPEDGPLVCTCAHGRRGGDAAARLAAAGFATVNLEGGLACWADAQLPHDGTIKRHH